MVRRTEICIYELRHVETYRLEVRLICSEGLSGVSRALFHPEIASYSYFFDRYQELVLFLRQFATKTVDNVVKSS